MALLSWRRAGPAGVCRENFRVPQETEASQALFDPDQVLACGYESKKAEMALAALHARLGQVPAGLFVNSIGCFEGVLHFLSGLPEDEVSKSTFGCFDYDPFATLSRFPLRMYANVPISWWVKPSASWTPGRPSQN